MSAAPTHLMHAEHLHLKRGRRAVVSDVSFTIHANQMVGIIGPNGSGKSSLMRLLAGVIAPDTGSLHLNGQLLSTMTRAARAQSLSYLPQETRVYWDFTVDDVLELGLARGQPTLRLRASQQMPLPKALIAEFELQELMGRVLNQLSGGERARVLLAAAVAGHPQLLLADEPMASLDVCHQLGLMQRLQALRERTASVIVMHDLNLAARFADRLLLLDQARVVAFGSVDEVLGSPLLDRVFRVAFERERSDGVLKLYPHTAT